MVIVLFVLLALTGSFCFFCAQIVWNGRLQTDVHNRYAMTTVDGTDFAVNEVHPTQRELYSHKIKSAALRYEIAISINGGDIVHINGPFHAGAWSDLRIFHEKLKGKLLPGEMVEADSGYAGDPNTVRLPNHHGSAQEKEMKARARARHETCNRRFKQMAILKNRFRHPLWKHGMVFEAIAVSIQIDINTGNSLFSTNYA